MRRIKSGHGGGFISGVRRAALPLLGVLLLATQVGCGGRVSDKQIRPIALDELVELYAKDQTKPNTLELIDPRPASAFAAGHIAGARNLELGMLDPDLGRDPMLDKRDMLVVYGDNRGSAIARAATKRLLEIGYSRGKVRWYAGGLAEWRAAGRPVDTAPLEDESDTGGG